MERKNSPDFILAGICFLLIFLGILILASVSASFSLQKTGTPFYFLNHQLLIGLLPGLIFGAAAFFAPLEVLKKWSFAILIANIVLLALVFAPGIGAGVGGIHRWIYIGPFSFQPSELLKITFILYMASWLASRTARPKESRLPQPVRHPAKQKIRGGKQSLKETFLPFLVIMGLISALLILQPDISTLGVIGATALLMYFLAGTPLWHTFLMVGAGAAGLAVLILMAPYRLSRLAVFLNPSLDPLGQGYQIKQALIGIGSGGIAGTGLGLSFQKFGVLPVPISDSVFAVFAEETGFIGAAALVILFFAFAWRSFIISKRASDDFASLTAAGIAFWIFLQSVVNIGSMLGLLPLTGIPLPFISYGGSALFAELIAVGILLNISRQKA